MFEVNHQESSALGRAYMRSTAFYVQSDAQYQLIMTKATTVANRVIAIQNIAMELIATNDLPFEWRTLGRNDVALFRDSFGAAIFGMLMEIDLGEFAEQFPLYEFNPVWGHLLAMIDERKLIEQVRSPRWKIDGDALMSLVDDLNLWIHDYREAFRSQEFEHRFKRYLERSISNEGALQQLLDGTFECYPRVMAIRMDLRCKNAPDSTPDGQSPDDLEVVSSHREAFLTEARHVFSESLIACAWKLEHSQQKGHGYHVLFLFDGSKVSDDVVTGVALGEMWDRAVTQGAGGHYSYNANKGTANLDHVGLISRRQTREQRLFKECVLNYMVKADYFMQVRTELADQAFGIVCFANPTLAAMPEPSPMLGQG